jgi:EamA domain-containing membrane protein RarD
MNRWSKILGFGFLTWLVPFIISFLVFPLHASQRAFFETIMAVVVTSVAVVFSILYLRQVQSGFVGEGALIGVAWFAINLAIDLLLFLPPSPMQMSFPDYMIDIGLTYLIYPIVSVGFGYLLDLKERLRAVT